MESSFLVKCMRNCCHALCFLYAGSREALLLSLLRAKLTVQDSSFLIQSVMHNFMYHMVFDCFSLGR